MAYDEKYRRRALEYWADGNSKKKTAAVFKVGTTTLQKWKSQLKENGNLESKKRKQTFRKINPDELQRHIENHPDEYLREIAIIFYGSLDTSIFALGHRGHAKRIKQDFKLAGSTIFQQVHNITEKSVMQCKKYAKSTQIPANCFYCWRYVARLSALA